MRNPMSQVLETALVGVLFCVLWAGGVILERAHARSRHIDCSRLSDCEWLVGAAGISGFLYVLGAILWGGPA